MKNQGDLEARKKLIEHNLRLVRHVAIKYLSVMKQPLDDVISIGIFGLIKAVDFFDITINIKFSSYDFKAISNEYNRYLQLNVGTKRDYSNDISLEQSIGNYNDPDSLTLGDTLSTDEDI